MHIALASLLVLALSVISLPGVATAADHAVAAAGRPEGAPEPGRAIRLVGDAAVKPTLEGEQYRLPEAGVGVEAPLPQGYPAPTPPGMIELKTYPVVRRVERSNQGPSDTGMVTSFFPLFNHIKKRQIAMTSPVEMDYRSGGDGKPLAAQPVEDCEWTVSFLYRTPDLGPAGADGNVKVVDVPEVVVVSIGMNDGYGSATVEQGLKSLQTWFDGQETWEPAGDPRTLMYNGPGAPFRQPWSEVQVPVRRKKPADPARAE